MTRSELFERSIANARTAIFCQQHGDYEFPALQEVRHFTLDLLLAEQKRSDGCEYCKHFGKPSAVMWDVHDLKSIGENESHKSFIGISILTRKNEGQLSVFSQSADNKQNKITVLINYCPYCGRDLTEGELDRERNPKTCDGCRDEGLLYCGNCIECVRARNYTDNYEPKGEKA